jgi:hypothetical protein
MILPELPAQATVSIPSFRMSMNQFEPLFKDLEGVILVVPAITALCPDWPLGMNPRLESIQEEYWSWVHQ